MASDHPWLPFLADLPSTADLHTMDRQAGAPRLDAHHSYTLPELVDVAEQHNPETRQTLGLFEPFCASLRHLRLPDVPIAFTAAREQPVISNFAFNTAHLDILFETAPLLPPAQHGSQQEAAELT